MVIAHGRKISTSLVAAGLAAILLFPAHSIFADGITVATSRAIYSPDEKILVVGNVPVDEKAALPVLISIVASDGAVCNTGTVIPTNDGNFVSTPIEMRACGTGHYEARISYGNASAVAPFDVLQKGKLDSASTLQIRIIESIVKEGRDLANSKVRLFLQDGKSLPSEIADEYGQGISESSAALSAAEFGDTDTAKVHSEAATSYFRNVIVLLNSLQSKSEVANLVMESNDTSSYLSVNQTIGQLAQYAGRLDELASKNGYGSETWHGKVSALLDQAGSLTGSGDLSGARGRLFQAASLLEQIRIELVNQAKISAVSSVLNSNSSNNTSSDSRLESLANYIASSANYLLSQSIPRSAQDLLNQSLSLVANARDDLSQGATHDAKKALGTALADLNDAKRIVEEPNGGNGGSQDKGAGSNSTSEGGGDSGSSGNGSSRQGNGNNTSDNG